MPDGKKRMFGRRGWVLAALFLFTAVNIYIQARRSSNAPVSVTTIALGNPLPALEVRELGSDAASPEPLLTPAACQLVVVFSATCPFCHKSAMDERRYATDAEGRLATTWVTDTEDEGAVEFRELVAPESRVVYAKDALKELDIQAVPAGILVGADGEIVDRFAYTGTEDHDRMRGQCAA